MRTSTKIQRITMQTALVSKLRQSSSSGVGVFAVSSAICIAVWACNGVSKDSSRAEENPADAGANNDASAEVSNEAGVDGSKKPDAECEIVDGGCPPGCHPSYALRYDMVRQCFPDPDGELMLCFDEYDLYPAAMVAMLDPEGNCWITGTAVNTYNELGWRNASDECRAGLGDHPVCPETP